MIEGFIVNYLGIKWIVRGCFTYNNRIIALPRYITEEKYVRTIKDPIQSLKIAELIAPSVISYMPCMGRKMPLLDLGRVEIIDPRKYVIDEDYEKSIIAHELVMKLKEMMDLKNIGITGGLLVGKQTSDIDIVIYGEKDSIAFYKYIKQNPILSPYTKKTVYSLLKKRKQKYYNKKLLEKEINKKLQGTYKGVEVYIRLVPCLPENPLECNYKVIKKEEIKAKIEITDDSRSFIYPCTYKARLLSSSKIIDTSEVIVSSDRGRYCELLSTGEKALVYGELEKIEKDNGISYQIYLWKNNHYLVPLEDV